MFYMKRNNGNPYITTLQAELRKYPNLRYPTPLDKNTLEFLDLTGFFHGPEPEYDPIRQVISPTGDIIPFGNRFMVNYVVIDLDEEKVSENLSKLASEMRDKRNQLLSESDWTQVPDAPVNKEAWALYRQALRDVTGQSGFPENIVWPVKP
jgi:hypothetical protein